MVDEGEAAEDGDEESRLAWLTGLPSRGAGIAAFFAMAVFSDTTVVDVSYRNISFHLRWVKSTTWTVVEVCARGNTCLR